MSQTKTTLTTLPNNLNSSRPEALEQRPRKLLKKLITPQGIFASSAQGWDGEFHAFFGRDSSITASLIFEAEQYSGHPNFSRFAAQALQNLTRWQGQRDNPKTGEQKGKIAHEVRIRQSDINQLADDKQPLHSLALKRYIDPVDHVYKSWDSVDSTPLWVIVVARAVDQNLLVVSKETKQALRRSLDWCLNNMQAYDGWGAFCGTCERPNRRFIGLEVQSWKDNYGAYQYPDGTLAEQPIKDAWVQGLFWAALKYGTQLFRDSDPNFARKLAKQADSLKERFNNPSEGFLMEGTTNGLAYFAEAIDGRGQQLTAVASEPAMNLWAYYEDECIIDSRYVNGVVNRLMQPDIFNPEAGIRNYSCHTQAVLYSNGYHRGPNTYWPFVSGLIAHGLDHFGFKAEAREVAASLLSGAAHFASCIELFLETKEGDLKPWHNPHTPQQSARDQAWTAAAMYWASKYLKSSKSPY